MGAVMVDKLKQQAEDARRHAERLEKMAELAQELGDEGLSELVAMLAPEATNGAYVSAVNGRSTGGVIRESRASTPDAPRGRDAVRLIVKDRPGIWTLQQLRGEMVARGWFTTSSGLEAAVKRLCDVNGEGRRIGKGRYEFPSRREEVTHEGTLMAPAAAIRLGESTQEG